MRYQHELINSKLLVRTESKQKRDQLDRMNHLRRAKLYLEKQDPMDTQKFIVIYFIKSQSIL